MTNFGLFQAERLFSQTERVCRCNFEFDENGRKLFRWVENTGWKGEIARYKQFGEIARYEQFPLSHSVERLVLQTHKSQRLFGKGLKV